MSRKNVVWMVTLALFVAYILFLSYLLFFSVRYRFISDIHSVNLVPFQEILRYRTAPFSYACIVNVYGNIAAFIPFGFLIIPVTKWKLKLPFAFLACFLSTCLVECLQLLTHVGVFDVDDIILNFVGGAMGIGLYKLVELVVITILRKRNTNA